MDFFIQSERPMSMIFKEFIRLNKTIEQTGENKYRITFHTLYYN